MQKYGKAVLVHCSDGWDRTSQLTSLSQIMLDGFYRTIVGFEILIEKDFVMFGHQFQSRLGHTEKNALSDHEFCPVFLQFLDCVYQIMNQYPTIFEFNVKFLCDIAHHAFSLRFGTFLMNTDKQRRDIGIRGKTVSLWSYMNARKEEYKNPLYFEKDPDFNEERFYPDPALPKLKLWEEYYLCWSMYKHSVMYPWYFHTAYCKK